MNIFLFNNNNAKRQISQYNIIYNIKWVIYENNLIYKINIIIIIIDLNIALT